MMPGKVLAAEPVGDRGEHQVVGGDETRLGAPPLRGGTEAGEKLVRIFAELLHDGGAA
ncbi:hypothetical protein ACTMTU_35530 [Streptomyces sp. OZ13]|uniref:hypothetical protein n=1 Tax=Streptomyces sp. OZ13 TaxID=3452210 RepID=UPI003F8ABFF7